MANIKINDLHSINNQIDDLTDLEISSISGGARSVFWGIVTEGIIRAIDAVIDSLPPSGEYEYNPLWNEQWA